MSVASVVAMAAAKEAAKVVAKSAVKKLNKSLFKDRTSLRSVLSSFPEKINLHTVESITWSSSIPLLGESQLDTKESTVHLDISAQFGAESEGGTTNFSEEQILAARSNTLIVGHAGSGKTTTVKRLLYKFYFGECQSPFGCTILIRLRGMRHSTISDEILSILGVKKTSRTFEEEGFEYKKNPITKTQMRVATVKKRKVYYVGEQRLDQFVPELLDSVSAILFIDGLDELPKKKQKTVWEELKVLGLRLQESKIVVTIRKSRLVALSQGFSKYEILPLDSARIRDISKKWLGYNNRFLKELESKPYEDLANRPLFLTFLLLIYKAQQNLPNQPNEVYKEATFLVLKDWDEHRSIHRDSDYSDFGPRKKLRFLCDVAYNLTYKTKSKTFKSRQLEDIFTAIHAKYSLPLEDMVKVVSEIESHNGIIMESEFKTYEFCHLSIQEYLCAEHLVTLPISVAIVNYFLEYPDPIAIAVCIAGSPDEWFANLVLSLHSGIVKSKNYKDAMYTLLMRMKTEHPLFNVNRDLGYAVLRIIFDLGEFDDFEKPLCELLDMQNVRKSTVLALSEFEEDKEVKLGNSVFRKIPVKSILYVELPYKGFIPTALYQNIYKD